MSHRQLRWLDFLSQYDLAIQPIKGKDNIVGDALSRRPDLMTANWELLNGSDVLNFNVQISAELYQMVAKMYIPDKMSDATKHRLWVLCWVDAVYNDNYLLG